MNESPNELANLITMGQSELSAEKVAASLAVDVQAKLDIDLVTIWQFDEALQSMDCIACASRDVSKNLIGTILAKQDYPNYFKYLLENISLSSSDVSLSDLLCKWP